MEVKMPKGWNETTNVKPKKKGGLGIYIIKFKNEAPLLKYLDKFYKKKKLPWVKLVRDAYYQNNVPHATIK
jgi:hypothetical protein